MTILLQIKNFLLNGYVLSGFVIGFTLPSILYYVFFVDIDTIKGSVTIQNTTAIIMAWSVATALTSWKKEHGFLRKIKHFKTLNDTHQKTWDALISLYNFFHDIDIVLVNLNEDDVVSYLHSSDIDLVGMEVDDILYGRMWYYIHYKYKVKEIQRKWDEFYKRTIELTELYEKMKKCNMDGFSDFSEQFIEGNSLANDDISKLMSLLNDLRIDGLAYELPLIEILDTYYHIFHKHYPTYNSFKEDQNMICV